jgi:hypothetical protein
MDALLLVSLLVAILAALAALAVTLGTDSRDGYPDDHAAHP